MDASLVGQLVSGRYRVLSALGTGGMGRVYLAEHVAIQKRVALKVLHPQYSQKRDIVERFQQEAISASRIKHPGVLDVFDFGELPDGSAYIAMELLEGRDLGETLEKFGPLRPELALEVLLQVCRALDAAHAAGVVHRDLKPDNVFLHGTGDGHPIVKIVDFGIARLRESDESTPESEGTQRRRLTKTGMIFGTPEYMAPEQAQGKEADARSDIYSTGVILFELLTGAVPFTGKSFLEVLNRHVLFAVPRLAEVAPELVVSPELEDVMRRALAKNPAERFASMRELAEALLQLPEAASLRAERASQSAWRVRGAAPASKSSPSSVSSPAVTQVAGTPLTASEDVLPKRGMRGAVVGGGAALVAALAAAYFVTQSPSAPGSTTQGSPAQAHDEVSPSPGEKTAASRAAGPAAPSTTPSPDSAARIALHVATNPSGAVVQKDGFQVCDATPCDVLATPNETLVLTAELGDRRGEAKVLAQREQNVSITLRPAAVRPKAAPRAAAPRPSSAPTQAPALCEVVVDGLKILRPCQ
jgi:serine/threonine-protein kinase